MAPGEATLPKSKWTVVRDMQQCAFRFAAQAASEVSFSLAPESQVVRGRKQVVHRIHHERKRAFRHSKGEFVPRKVSCDNMIPLRNFALLH